LVSINGAIILFNNVGIISRLDNQDALELSIKLYKILLKEGIEVVPEEGFARVYGLGNSSLISKMDTDLIITVGGDGTVLKTCMFMPKPEIPILAVNMGRRGYLTEVEPNKPEKAIQRCLSGDYKIEELDKLTVIHKGRKMIDGLNEALIASITHWKMLDFEISLNKEALLTSRADALIIATSTGSTAHALSAGGPVVHASLNAFVLVFLCPLEPIHPIVIPNDSEIGVKVTNAKLEALVTVDGFFKRKLKPEQEFSIKKSDHKANFIRLGKASVNRTQARLLKSSQRD
jgi:NAD+ kinase